MVIAIVWSIALSFQALDLHLLVNASKQTVKYNIFYLIISPTWIFFNCFNTDVALFWKFTVLNTVDTKNTVLCISIT